MIAIASETRCKNPKCGKPVVQISGHRKRQYCNDTCKQTAYRLRKDNHGVTIVDDRQALDQKNIAQYQEKLATSAARIQKLERQVEVQRLKLKEAYHSKETRELVIVQQEQELARYRQIVDLSDRQQMTIDFMQCGERIGYQPLLSLEVKRGLHYWQTFMDGASDEALASAIVVAYHVWKQGEDLKTIREIVQQDRIIAELRQELEKCKRNNQS